MTDPNIFNIILVWPFLNILVLCFKVLSFFSIPFSLGFSIIALTVLIRIVLYPLTTAQLKASKKMQEISPHLARLKERHKGDAKTLQQETMKLYKEFGVNPAAGCLPILIQIPIIWGLYSVLNHIVKLGPGDILNQVNQVVYFDFLKISKIWDTHFFGLPLGQTPSQLLQSIGLIILFVPIITGVLQFIQSKMLFPKSQKTPTTQKKQMDFTQAFQTQTTYLFPIMIGFFSYTFPIGLSIYWNTFTVFGIIQQYLVQGKESLLFITQYLKR
ncbi:MAG TPA: YidC/Oxa1 family membrane protein insertase [Candidatus Nanoarchaeia archaeon]|nr:MAG: hypothetical protein A3I49_01505 [Candidatus Levybacteria bacterium RIFCSPLOWO2_02_FULL_37_11]HJZ18619.1 YidC/Oxa1 family membrane protein insertase [Candidatus Nanoarchaeia archaeon]